MKYALQAPTVEIQRKIQVNAEENTQMIRSCVSLTKRAHKLEKMGVPSKMHPRDKTRAHLSASQRKMGLGGRHLGPAKPRRAPVQVRLGGRFDLIL